MDLFFLNIIDFHYWYPFRDFLGYKIYLYMIM